MWIRFYSGRAELTSHLCRVLHGFLCLYLKKFNWKKRKEQTCFKNVYIWKRKIILSVFVSYRHILHSERPEYHGLLLQSCNVHTEDTIYICAPFVTVTSSQSDRCWFSDRVSDRRCQAIWADYTADSGSVRQPDNRLQIQKDWLFPESLACEAQFQFYNCILQ